MIRVIDAIKKGQEGRLEKLNLEANKTNKKL